MRRWIGNGRPTIYLWRQRHRPAVLCCAVRCGAVRCWRFLLFFLPTAVIMDISVSTLVVLDIVISIIRVIANCKKLQVARSVVVSCCFILPQEGRTEVNRPHLPASDNAMLFVHEFDNSSAMICMSCGMLHGRAKTPFCVVMCCIVLYWSIVLAHFWQVQMNRKKLRDGLNGKLERLLCVRGTKKKPPKQRTTDKNQKKERKTNDIVRRAGES